MNCQKFESIVDDLAREQIMEATLREQAILHSDGCAECAARLRDEQTLTQGLRELSVVMQQDRASDDIEARLVGELRSYLRKHQAAKNHAGGKGYQPPTVVGLSQNSRNYWKYAAAAGIVIAVALGVAANRFWRAGFSSGPVEIPGNRAPLANLQPVEGVPIKPKTAADLTASSNITPRGLPGKSGRLHSRRSRGARSTVTVQSLSIMPAVAEVTTDFIPIGYGNASNVQEGGQVVRLELPRYAMARFGVPINEERYDERVKADVWVGADGFARAIRFVQ